MPFNPFSVLTSKIFGLTSIVLLLALGAQTLRMHHYHAQAEKCALGRAEDRSRYEQAQRDALAKALTAKAAQEADYKAKAERADHAKDQAVAAQRAADLLFIAAHRVPDQTAAGAPGRPAPPSDDSNPGLPQDLSGVSVVVSGQDVPACSEWVSFGLAARAWALSLTAHSVP